MPQANINNQEIENRKEALADPVELLTKLNEDTLNQLTPLNTLRNAINNGDGLFGQGTLSIISSLSPENTSNLTDSEKLDLLIQNQRDLAILINRILQVLNATRIVLLAIRSSLAMLLRTNRRNR